MKFEQPKGFQDFYGDRAKMRVRVMDTIRSVFERYNFEPLETPLMEPIEVLTAKFAAGEESDALDETYRLTDKNGKKFGLRFDLTVPLSRFVAGNNRLPNPYKRYAMGNVFRDAAVDKNRYREFTQCDADVVGEGGTLYDAEVLLLAMNGYQALGIQAEMRLNNRKFLFGLLDAFGIPADQRESVLISVDKLDKMPAKKVVVELIEKGTKEAIAAELVEVLTNEKNDLEFFSRKYPQNEGLVELNELFSVLKKQGAKPIFSPSMVRGLAYYTGMIVEFKDANQRVNGSIGSGGRYDDMIGQYADNGKKIPAVGVSFGIERILDLLEAQGSELAKNSIDYYIVPVGIEPEKCFGTLQELRKKGYRAEMDFQKRSVSKGLENANKKNARFAIMIGDEELMQRELTVKDLKAGKQEKSTMAHIPDKKSSMNVEEKLQLELEKRMGDTFTRK